MTNDMLGRKVLVIGAMQQGAADFGKKWLNAAQELVAFLAASWIIAFVGCILHAKDHFLFQA